ncbi:ABC-type transport auxiliary lipoprotein family protein [Legionella adelaidensis]|uniref:ABC-type transport auxiliary lipoprotein family protein n=1 Tax=Legionella adelaidensis TaxID=45056 RepID=UPI00389946E4
MIGFVCLSLLLTGCAVKTPVDHQYKLDAFSSKSYLASGRGISIMVSQPEAVGGYQTEQMLYQKKPYELQAFVKNAWVAPPASMLFPLVMQSLQKTGYFHAVSSAPYADKADYRLDVQLLELQQNFLCKPSFVELVVKVVLTRMEDDQVVASRIFSHRVKAPQDTPYGGVVAANQATREFTGALTQFVIAKIQKNQ